MRPFVSGVHTLVCSPVRMLLYATYWSHVPLPPVNSSDVVAFFHQCNISLPMDLTWSHTVETIPAATAPKSYLFHSVSYVAARS